MWREGLDSTAERPGTPASVASLQLRQTQNLESEESGTGRDRGREETDLTGRQDGVDDSVSHHQRPLLGGLQEEQQVGHAQQWQQDYRRFDGFPETHSGACLLVC